MGAAGRFSVNLTGNVNRLKGGGFNSLKPCVTGVPKVHCPDCGRDIAMHELEAKTTAQSNGFNTRYRCPFCRSDMNDVTEHLV